MKRIIIALVTIAMTSVNHAQSNGSTQPWFVDAAFGMTKYPGMMDDNEKTAAGRVGLGFTLLDQHHLQLAVESGIQSGNTMRLDFSKEAIDGLGGVPIEAQIKPLLDLLVGVNLQPLKDLPLTVFVKGGTAYRQLQVDHDSVNALSAFSPEIQAGLGYRINDKTRINLSYQSIFGDKPSLTVNPLTETGILQNLPSQQAVMIGFTFNF